MKIFLFLFFLLFISLPGFLLILSSSKFRSKGNIKSGNFLLAGSVFILVHLFLSSGTYLVSSLGNAEDVANYAMTNAWLGGGLKYLGLLSIALGLFMYQRKASG